MSLLENVVLKLQEIGAYQFMFPFMLSSAVFYGLLRKSQVFGDPARNTVVNAVVSIVASFMVWSFPILSGINIETQLASFFLQGLVVTMTLVIALMLGGLIFPEGLPQFLAERMFKKEGGEGWVAAIIIVGIAVGVIIFVTSGFFNLFFGNVAVGIPSDILLTIGVIIVLMIPLILIFTSGPPSMPPKKEGGETREGNKEGK